MTNPQRILCSEGIPMSQSHIQIVHHVKQRHSGTSLEKLLNFLDLQNPKNQRAWKISRGRLIHSGTCKLKPKSFLRNSNPNTCNSHPNCPLGLTEAFFSPDEKLKSVHCS